MRIKGSTSEHHMPCSFPSIEGVWQSWENMETKEPSFRNQVKMYNFWIVTWCLFCEFSRLLSKTWLTSLIWDWCVRNHWDYSQLWIEQGLTKLKLMVVETYRSDFLNLWFSLHDYKVSGSGLCARLSISIKNSTYTAEPSYGLVHVLCFMSDCLISLHKDCKSWK